MRRYLNLLVAVLAVVSSVALGAQTSAENPNTVYNPALYGAMKYRLIGPHRGGRVTAVAGVPDEPQTYYMGATGGGVWKTTDGGTAWHNISDGFFKVGSIGAIAAAESDSNVVYVGTGSACPRGNVSIGDGVWKSTDAGKTWKHVGLPKAGQIARIAVHPADPDRVYVAVLGNVFGPGPDRGVYRSRDGGDTWERVLFASDTTGAVDLVMNPGNPRILYACMWRAERKPWTLIDGSDDGGVFKSADGGDTWERLKGGLPEGLVGRPGVAVSPANPERVWVIIESEKEEEGGLYRSEDAGKTWTKISGEHKLRGRAWYYNHVFAGPQDENTVYVLNAPFYKSIDGGKTFEQVRVPHGDNHALWINPRDPRIMINGNDGGANVSYNGGRTWSTQLNQPTAEFYRVTVDSRFPYRVYGAQQDNTTISVPSRTPGGITPQEHWYDVGGGESGHIAVDPRNPDVIYAGNYIGQITRLDRAAGHMRQVNAYPELHDGLAPRDMRYRFQWNAPIRISPHDPRVIYHTSQYVHKSTDGGQTWQVISPDLTTDNDRYQDIPGGPIQHDHTGVELFTTIFAFEESPHQAGFLWAGSDDGLVHLTRNGGKDWSNITPGNMPKDATVNMIELSAHGPAAPSSPCTTTGSTTSGPTSTGPMTSGAPGSC
ncbi:MAG: glycosyl hydrolase [Acidobacteriota bacterium]